MRERIVTISLYYQLESFARLETKLNLRSLLHHYELSQRSSRYKNDKRDVTPCREYDGRVSLHGRAETCSYVLLNARNGRSPGI
jgi:hypothetical protein